MIIGDDSAGRFATEVAIGCKPKTMAHFPAFTGTVQLEIRGIHSCWLVTRTDEIHRGPLRKPWFSVSA